MSWNDDCGQWDYESPPEPDDETPPPRCGGCRHFQKDIERVRWAARHSCRRLRAKIAELRALLLEARDGYWHEPDSDAMEFCHGCGRSSYHLGEHRPGCLVARIADALGHNRETDQ